jgi:Uma2 family endonuclease
MEAADEHRLGTAIHGVGVRFTPDNVLIPDICFVDVERRHVIGPRVVDAAPDLIVEALSPETRQRDLTVKRSLYARFGVREFWIVDPDAGSIVVLTLVGDRYQEVPNNADGTVRSPVLPNLNLVPVDVFKSVRETPAPRST